MKSRLFIAYKMRRFASINCYMLGRVLKRINKIRQKVKITLHMKHNIYGYVYFNLNVQFLDYGQTTCKSTVSGVLFPLPLLWEKKAWSQVTHNTSVSNESAPTGIRWLSSFPQYIKVEEKFNNGQCTGLENCHVGVCGSTADGANSIHIPLVVLITGMIMALLRVY